MLLPQQKAKENHFIYIALLLLIAIVAYWQISFLKYSVTHDMVNCWIPWRHYISESLQAHTFPFWDPYQQLGYPIHADLQGPSWYIESLLLGSTIGESNYVVQLLFIFYVFLAGVGMYFLSLCFHENKNVAFITAFCYMLSGFFVAHVQHFYAVIGAAWLPFIILNYYRMHTERSYKRAIYASLFLFFNLTGGNHTFTFILSYLFILVGGYFLITALKEKKKEIVFQLLKLNALFVVLTAALSTVVFVVFIQVKPYIGRLSGMSYKDASLNPLSPQSLLSLVVPFSTINNTDFYNTDPSMCNIYIGLILFPFILLALFRSKTTLEKILLIFAGICLLASFGSYTPVHKFLFNFFPFMDLFRFPSYFSLFTLIILLVLGGKQLAFTLSSFVISKDKLVKIIGALILLILLLVIFACIKNNSAAYFFFNHFDTVFDFTKAGNFYQNIVLQGCIQLVLLLALLVTILKASEIYRLKIITVFVVLDMLCAVQLNLAYVGFSSASPKELHDYIATLPKGFPIPPMNNISENTEELGQKHGLYRNTSVFHKRISADVFNSFCFKNQVLMIDSFPVLYDSMRHNPLVYFSDDIYSEKELKSKSIKITNKTIVFNDEDYRIISSQIKPSANDSIAAKIIEYRPDRIVISAKSSTPELLTLLQNQYTGWKVFVDGQESKILLSNFMTMSVVFPKGEHTITFEYYNKPVIIGAIISYSFFILILIILSVIWIKENKMYVLVGLMWLVLLGSAGHYFL
ncbi:MAG: hypothetical protein NTX97_08515 [Bacteroidetes bacterium]|nr:hypothetical protein [Bacteroidota bacterium]